VPNSEAFEKFAERLNSLDIITAFKERMEFMRTPHMGFKTKQRPFIYELK